MSDIQNAPLPDPGPGDGAHEGDDWDMAVAAATPDGVDVENHTDGADEELTETEKDRVERHD